MAANTHPSTTDLLQNLLNLAGAGHQANSLSSSPMVITILVMSTALLPFILLSVTSFVKLSVVFAILRNALGAGQIPSATVSTLLAFVLTLHIMNPVFIEAAVRAENSWKANSSSVDAKNQAQSNELSNLMLAIGEASVPFREFMKSHSRPQEIAFFARLELTQGQPQAIKYNLLRGDTDTDVPADLTSNHSWTTLIPSFVLSQLREAFIIGFILFIPFLIVDLVIANILVGLGMMMVSPVAISLPFKIILFVAADGWFNLCKGLVLGY